MAAIVRDGSRRATNVMEKRPSNPNRDAALDQCIRFLSCIFEPDDSIGFSALDVGWTRHARLEELVEVVDDCWLHNGKSNVYFMANPGDGAGMKAHNIPHARCLFVDFDRTITGERGVSFDDAAQRIKDANLPIPTAWVNSGKGIHAYWRLEEPIEDLKEWRGRQRALIRALDTDPCIHNPNRLMRLPGFRNRKHSDAPLASLIDCDAERVYSASEFPDPLPEPAAPAKPVTQGSMSRYSGRFIDTGWLDHHGRRHTMFTCACDLKARGWDFEDAKNVIMERMRKLDLSASELSDCPRQIANAFSKDRVAISNEFSEDEAVIPAENNEEEADLDGVPASGLMVSFPELRPEVVRGLLRVGETMNIIAPPKVGKSWLVMDLALSIAAGIPWLDTYPTVKGEVLLLDNELHRETSAWRFRKMVDEAGRVERSGRLECRRRGYGAEAANGVTVRNLRGELRDLSSLGQWIRALPRGKYKLIVLDAFYRFMPREWDENDNGTMSAVYNLIDSYAASLGAAVVCIHHASKGNQSGKAVTDVGAGAGAQSRAVDTHLVLRAHEEADAIVLDTAARSFPPIEPRCFRWRFPFWEAASDLDPANLKTEKVRKVRAERLKPFDPVEAVQSALTQDWLTLTQFEERLSQAMPGQTVRAIREIIRSVRENPSAYGANVLALTSTSKPTFRKAADE